MRFQNEVSSVLLLIACRLLESAATSQIVSSVTAEDDSVRLTTDLIQFEAELRKLVPGEIQDESVEAAVQSISQRNFDSALSLLRKAAKEHPADWRPHHLMAIAHYGAHNYTAALQAADDCVRTRPDWGGGYWLRAAICLALSKPDEAEIAYTRSIEIAPDEPGGHLQRGRFRVLYRSTSPSEILNGIRDLQSAQQLGAPEVTVLGLQGVAYQTLGKTKEAESKFRRVLALDPNSLDAVERLAKLYDLQGRFTTTDKLLAGYQDQLNMADRTKAARWALIFAKHAARSKADSKLTNSYYRLATSGQSPPPLAAVSYAQWLESIDRLGDGLPVLQAAASGDAVDPHLAAQIAWVLAETGGNLKEAKEWIAVARRYAPDDPYRRDTEAWIQFREGQYAASFETLRPCLHLAETTPEIAFHAAAILEKLGQGAQARHYLKLAMARDDFFSGRREALELKKKLAKR